MTRIVTTHYRYKRPPRKRKAVAVEAPAVVITKSSRRQPVGRKEQAAAEVRLHTPVPGGKGALQPSTPRAAARVAPPANDDRKPAIVTIKRKSRFGDAPDMTPEEHQRRGDAADALWRELVRRATANLFLAATMAFTLCNVSGCASIVAYEASHPPYRFPKSYVGGGG
jgi:hypothetical protein